MAIYIYIYIIYIYIYIYILPRKRGNGDGIILSFGRVGKICFNRTKSGARWQNIALVLM